MDCTRSDRARGLAKRRARLGNRRGVQSGTYTLLVADAIEGECTVDCSDFGPWIDASTVVEGGAIKLTIRRRGLMILAE